MVNSSNYVVRRFLSAGVVLLLAITLDFALFRIAPGSYASKFTQVPGLSPATRAALGRQYGVGVGIWTQYREFLVRLLQGDLGTSYANSQSVASNLASAYLNTIPMVVAAVILSVLLGTTLGMIAAWRHGAVADHAVMATSLIVYSLPTQLVGLVLVGVFGHWLPVTGRENVFLLHPSSWQHVVDLVRHMILPSATLALALFGQYAIVVRTTVIGALSEDFILTARAKGIGNRRVLIRHALRNAMLPVSTLAALSMGFVVSGSILVETVFSWPGIGRAIYQAVLQRDWPMLQGAFLVLTASVVLANLVVDLLYIKMDPRVTL